MIDLTTQRIVVTGGAGFLGKFVCKKLCQRGVPGDQLLVPRSTLYDLTTEDGVVRMYDDFEPDIVIHLAAEVGGIGANMAQPGRFFYANAAMGLHLVEHGRQRKIKKFIHIGTVCAYPKYANVPFKESNLWDGYPEETNAPYGIAKKAVFVMLDAYYRQYSLPAAVVVPVNLYGPHDNFDPETSHVIPALIRKCEHARINDLSTITCWGTGKATRQFLHVEDAAEGIIKATECVESPEPINLGGGEEIAINRLVKEICTATGYSGNILWDTKKPDGQPRRAIDITQAEKRLKWRPQMSFQEGLFQTVEWWRTHSKNSLPDIDGRQTADSAAA